MSLKDIQTVPPIPFRPGPQGIPETTPPPGPFPGEASLPMSGGPPGGLIPPGMPNLGPDPMGASPMGASPMGAPPGGISAAPGAPPVSPDMMQPPDMTPQNPFDDFFALLEQMVLSAGEDAAREIIKTIPMKDRDRIRQAISDEPDKLAYWDDLMSDYEDIEYPEWLPSYSAPPSKDHIEETVMSDWSEWEPIRQRIKSDLDLYHQNKNAVERKENKPFLSPSMSDEARSIIAMIGSIEPRYEVPWDDVQMQDETQLVEDALHAWDRESFSDYNNATGASYRMEAASYMVTTGYVISQQTINLSGDRPLFRERLLSPENTVPTWDGHGLSRITRRYSDTVDKVAADYDPSGELGVRKKLLKATNPKRVRKNGHSLDTTYQGGDFVMVKVYIDRWWVSIFADDVEVLKPEAHEYGFVPFAVAGSGVGDPVGMMSESEFDDNAGMNIQIIDTDTGQEQVAVRSDGTHVPIRGSSQSRRRLSYKNCSYFHFRKKFHAQKEEIISTMRTALDRVNNPAWLLEQDDFSRIQADPEASMDAGDMTKIRLGRDKLSPLMGDPNVMGLFMPLTNMIGQDEASNAIPKAHFGVFESANQSGNAMEGAFEAGKEKIEPFLDAMRSYYSNRAMVRLSLYRDWGHLVRKKYIADLGQQGLPVPRSRSRRHTGNSVAYITKETVKRAGTYVETKMTHLRMQNLAPLGNAGSIWMRQNAMSARDLMELRGESDPDGVFEEIRREKAMLDEGVQSAYTYAELARSDPDAAIFYKEYVLGKMNGPEGGPGGMSGGNFGAPNTSAMDLKSLGKGQSGPTGRPPGAQSGPPPEDVGP